MFKHILVPTDGSELSTNAVGKAVDFARETNARITFFYAKPDFPVTFYGEGALMDPITPERYAEAASKRAQDILSECEAAAHAAGVTCDSRTTTSDAPYDAVIETARETGCDLIFMASHGRRGIRGLLLGSETQKVLTHSTIPVLVFR